MEEYFKCFHVHIAMLHPSMKVTECSCFWDKVLVHRKHGWFIMKKWGWRSKLCVVNVAFFQSCQYSPGHVFGDSCQESTFEALSEWEARAKWPPVAHALEFPARPIREWHKACHAEDFTVYMRKLELRILVPPFTRCITLHEVVSFAIHKTGLIMLISHSCWEVRK